MADLADIRRHVLDDASELAATTGLMRPLLDDDVCNSLPPSKAAVVKFLQEHLMRHLVLLVVRLHENARQGPTGQTASNVSLLDHAVREGSLTSNEGCQFNKSIESLKVRLVKAGTSYDAIKKFRHAELAHSLHVAGKPRLPPGPVWDFAHDTFELIVDIDEKLRTADPKLPMPDLGQKFHKWRDLGEEFWSLSGG